MNINERNLSLKRMVPMRHKEFHGTLVTPSMKFVLDFGLSLMSDKLRKRVKFHTKLDEKDCVDRNILPKVWMSIF